MRRVGRVVPGGGREARRHRRAGLRAPRLPAAPTEHALDPVRAASRATPRRGRWGIALSYRGAGAPARGARPRAGARAGAAPQALFTPNAVEQTVVAEVRGTHAMPTSASCSARTCRNPAPTTTPAAWARSWRWRAWWRRLLAEGAPRPARTLTMLWGQEIRSTDRYITQDSVRARGIRWGMSLDMVGEDTEKTGGTFLIEKMPDPSAIWTRGDDQHTEWGGRPLEKEDLRPHYFNDYVLQRALAQAATTHVGGEHQSVRGRQRPHAVPARQQARAAALALHRPVLPHRRRPARQGVGGHAAQRGRHRAHAAHCRCCGAMRRRRADRRRGGGGGARAARGGGAHRGGKRGNDSTAPRPSATSWRRGACTIWTPSTVAVRRPVRRLGPRPSPSSRISCVPGQLLRARARHGGRRGARWSVARDAHGGTGRTGQRAERPVVGARGALASSASRPT